MLMMRDPPGVPSTQGPRGVSRNVGDMLDSGRLPGSIRFAPPPVSP